MTGAIDEFVERLRRNPTSELRDVAALRDQMNGFGARVILPEGVTETVCEVAGMVVHRFAAGAGPHVVYLHGGGYVAGSPASHRHVCALLAQMVEGTVDVPDYRLAPEAPFPAAIEDVMAVWLGLADGNSALVGDSAGGGLAFALALALRDAGHALPRCIVGLSPWVNHDLGDAADDDADPTLSRAALAWYSSLYAGARKARDPLLSPLFADLAGLPPTLVQAGGREVLCADAVSFDAALRAAGVSSRIDVWPELFHAWHLFWPWLEAGRTALDDAAAFIASHA